MNKFPYNKLSGHTSGYLTVIDVNTKEKVKITKKEFHENRNKYKHFNDNIKVSDKTKNRLSEMRKGYITAKTWDGSFIRIHKDDLRFKNGEVGNTTSYRWLVIDSNGNEFKTFNVSKFLKTNIENLYRYINVDGLVSSLDSKKFKSLNGWYLICLK